jgi:hypothetical protein
VITLEECIRLYIEALPAVLRPRRGDDRVWCAAETAQANEWSPRQAAAAVSGGRSYEGARNPALLALMRLEDLVALPAGTRPRRAAHPPHECDRGWHDTADGRSTSPCPICRPQLAARLALIPPPGQRTPEDYTYLRNREEVVR